MPHHCSPTVRISWSGAGALLAAGEPVGAERCQRLFGVAVYQLTANQPSQERSQGDPGMGRDDVAPAFGVHRAGNGEPITGEDTPPDTNPVDPRRLRRAQAAA